MAVECVCVHERALHGRLGCVRSVCVFPRACVRVVCVFYRACVARMFRVRARRVRVFTSVRAHRHLVCVPPIRRRSASVLDLGPFPAATLIKYILILIYLNQYTHTYL